MSIFVGDRTFLSVLQKNHLDCIRSEMKRLLDLVLNESDIRPTIANSIDMILLGLVTASDFPNKAFHCPSWWKSTGLSDGSHGKTWRLIGPKCQRRNVIGRCRSYLQPGRNHTSSSKFSPPPLPLSLTKPKPGAAKKPQWHFLGRTWRGKLTLGRRRARCEGEKLPSCRWSGETWPSRSDTVPGLMMRSRNLLSSFQRSRFWFPQFRQLFGKILSVTAPGGTPLTDYFPKSIVSFYTSP